jgi:hypothetical protein
MRFAAGPRRPPFLRLSLRCLPSLRLPSLRLSLLRLSLLRLSLGWMRPVRSPRPGSAGRVEHGGEDGGRVGAGSRADGLGWGRTSR